MQAEITLPATGVLNTQLNDLGFAIKGAIKNMRGTLQKMEGSSISFTPLFEVTKEELNALSESSRVLGCAPSFNLYGAKPLGVSMEYPVRSAGGHVHIGLANGIYEPFNGVDHRWRLVAILDAILGNTCVLLDQDRAQAERRKVYGRAGEHRLPRHGLEYRTLSNFWLRNWALTEFVMQMTSIGVDILNTSCTTREDVEGELMNPIDIDRMQIAINTNNQDMARETFGIVTTFLSKHLKPEENPLDPNLLPNFDRLVSEITRVGIDKVFPNAEEIWLKEECKVGSWKMLLERF